MKKIWTLCINTVFIFSVVSAQYCGNSGPNVCTPSTTTSQPGLSPQSSMLAPLINGNNTATTIQFENFNTLVFAGQTITIQSLTIDTISNLPGGLCWATNKTDNTFGNQETGCILITGTPCDTPGQYKLHIIVTANIGIPFTTNADVAHLHYFARLINNGEAVVPVDSTQTEAHPIKPYHVAAVCQALPLALSLDSNQTACSGSTVTITPAVSGGTGTYHYLWTSTGDTLFCPTCMSSNVKITKTDTFSLRIIDGNSDTAYASISYTAVGGGYNFNITETGPDVICSGGSVHFMAASDTAFTYRWLYNGSHISGAHDSVYNAGNVTTSGHYACAFYVATYGCRVISNAINVTVNPLPSVSLNMASPLCNNGAAVTLNQGIPPGGTYTIDHTSGATIFNPATEAHGAHPITYTYTDSLGCTDSVTAIVQVQVCNGVDAVGLENSIAIYPNPASNIVNLQSDLFGGNNIAPVIYDVTGNLITVSFTRKANLISFDTSHLPAGLYLIKLNIAGQTISKRFVKE